MLPRLLALLAVLCLALGCLPAAQAAGVVSLILSEDGSAYQEAAEAIRNELRSTGVRVQTVALPLKAESVAGNALVIPLGARAAMAVNDTDPRAPVLYTLLPRSTWERLGLRADDTRRHSAVFIDQPPGRQLDLIRLALPDWPRLAILAGRDSDHVGRLLALARSRGFKTGFETSARESEIYPALQRLLAEPAVLLAQPDPQVFNSNTISNILLTAYRQRSPVIGFSPAYVKAGALVSLYSTPTQIGAQAGEAARQLLATGSLPAPQHPRRFVVGTNPHVARSLGIPLADDNILHDRLERQEAAQ
ncbi:MAG: hypothetical protein HGA47_10225 [Zoogloea sp.]|nr:hypothetical protein [Zoogloea sp.]